MLIQKEGVQLLVQRARVFYDFTYDFTIEGCVTASKFEPATADRTCDRVSQGQGPGALFTCCLSWRLAAHQAREKCSSHVPNPHPRHVPAPPLCR